MAECDICGEKVSGGSSFTCTYCGGSFCPSHRLPFNHACTHIDEWRRSQPDKSRFRRDVKSRRVSGVLIRRVIAGAVVAAFILMMVAWFLRLF